MPLPKSKLRLRRAKKVYRKRRVAGKRQYGAMRTSMRTLSANKMDKATVVEVQELAAVPEGGNFINHHLSQFSRALAVSRQYRFYRCKKVEVEFIPYANVFAPGQAFPELYFQVDRTQFTDTGAPLPLPSKNIMMSRGVMPVKWTSVIKRSYTPSVLRTENLIQNVLGSDVQSIAGVTATPVIGKWYACQQYFAAPPGNAASFIWNNWAPQLLRYFGAAYYIDQPLAEPSAILGTIKIRVHWEFKQPLVTAEPPPPQATQQELTDAANSHVVGSNV